MDWKSTLAGFKAYLILERSMSPNTISAYEDDILKLVRYIKSYELGRGPLDVDYDLLSQFLISLSKLGLSARSLARIISGIRALYKYLLMEDLIDNDPTELIEGPRLIKKIPEVLSYNEINSMIASIDLSQDHGLRNKAMLETLYACGLRVTELVGLMISNYFPEMDVIKITGKNNKERIVPIGSAAKKHIQIYIEYVRNNMKNIQKDHEDFLFLNRRGSKLSRIMIFNIIKECAKNAGISTKVSPHTFRHSFATHLVEGGADLRAVQDMLGHESITTTEIYTHLDTDYLRDTILSFHPRNKRA